MFRASFSCFSVSNMMLRRRSLMGAYSTSSIMDSSSFFDLFSASTCLLSSVISLSSNTVSPSSITILVQLILSYTITPTNNAAYTPRTMGTTKVA